MTPYLIFTMLLLTFCKVSPRDLKPKTVAFWWLLLIQIGGAFLAYLLLYRFNKIVAEGSWFALSALRLLLRQSLLPSCYTFGGNIAAAVPILIEVNPVSFWGHFGLICPLVDCPFLGMAE